MLERRRARTRPAATLCGFMAAAVLVLLTSCHRDEQVASWEDPSAAASTLASAICSEAPADLASLFHYPPEMSDHELEKDHRIVESGLILLFREFGKVEGLQLTANPEPFAQVGLGGGLLPYWNQFPEQYSATFRARFSQEGEGFAKIVLRKRLDRWVLQSVNFGLPTARPGAGERIQQLMRLLVANQDRISKSATKGMSV